MGGTITLQNEIRNYYYYYFGPFEIDAGQYML